MKLLLEGALPDRHHQFYYLHYLCIYMLKLHIYNNKYKYDIYIKFHGYKMVFIQAAST